MRQNHGTQSIKMICGFHWPVTLSGHNVPYKFNAGMHVQLPVRNRLAGTSTSQWASGQNHMFFRESSLVYQLSCTRKSQPARNIFNRMGFDDEGIVALSGAHTLGRAFQELRDLTSQPGYRSKIQPIEITNSFISREPLPFLCASFWIYLTLFWWALLRTVLILAWFGAQGVWWRHSHGNSRNAVAWLRMDMEMPRPNSLGQAETMSFSLKIWLFFCMSVKTC